MKIELLRPEGCFYKSLKMRPPTQERDPEAERDQTELVAWYMITWNAWFTLTHNIIHDYYFAGIFYSRITFINTLLFVWKLWHNPDLTKGKGLIPVQFFIRILSHSKTFIKHPSDIGHTFFTYFTRNQSWRPRSRVKSVSIQGWRISQ